MRKGITFCLKRKISLFQKNYHTFNLPITLSKSVIWFRQFPNRSIFYKPYAILLSFASSLLHGQLRYPNRQYLDCDPARE